jgi:hypothetical protein
MCDYNDCGWCYLEEPNDANQENGACINPEECELNTDKEED